MRKLASFDAAIWIVVLVLVAASVAFFATWGYPMEDAAMVFNYSEKIAAGDGVVYITGGEKVDGASDLVLTFALAGLVWLGIPVQVGAAMLNGVALGVIVLLIFLSWNQPKIGRWPAIAAVCLFLTTTPVLFLGASGFGALVFAAMVAITAFLAQHTDDASSFQSLILLGLSVALAGMNRIEGFILAGLIVLAQAVGAKSLRIVAIPLGTTLAIAVAWFSWRWSYFGYPLPNSFYKKSGIYLGSAPIALRAVFEYTAPWIPLLFIGMLVERTRRRTFSYILLVIGPWAGIWVLLSNEMNHASRFQFPISPAAAIFCGSLILPMAPYLRRLQLRFRSMDARRVSAFPLAALGVISLVVVPVFLTARRQVTRLTALHTVTFPQEVADGIRQASHGSELVVTTEGGMIAWRSGLPVVDLWGLNDKRIARTDTDR